MFNPVYVLFAWIVACALLFAVLKPARACTLAFIIGWLVMPMARLKLPGLPDLDKVSTTSLGVVIGTLLFRTDQFRGYKLGWGEVFVVFFASTSFYTSVDNGLGPYDGLASLLDKLLYYGVPYVCGRAYIRTREEFRESAQLVVTAAALYALPALYEWRMSPQLHPILYGFGQQSFNLSHRWGFFRPIVCFPANLALGGFFCWTALLALSMYLSGELRPFYRFPKSWLYLAPIGGLIISMSMGPWVLFLVGAAAIHWWRKSAYRSVVLFAPLFAVVWMSARYTGFSDGKWLTEMAAEVSVQRAASLQYRIDAETMFIEKAQAPGQEWFGWGAWGRNRIRDEQGRDIVAIDGLWLILLTTYGLAGLIFFYMWWTFPVLLTIRAGPWLERDPAIMVILIAIGLQAVNFLFNAFLDPVLTMLVGATALQLEVRRATAARPAMVHTRSGVPTNAELSGGGA